MSPIDRFRPSFIPVVSLMAVMVFALTGCGEGGSPENAGWSGSVQDSAGVTIVTSEGSGAWTQDERWTVVEELRIGVESGDPELQFGFITGIDVDDAGNIYALDGQAARIRVFSPEGELIRAFGRAGSGPGEIAAGGAQAQEERLFLNQDGSLTIIDALNLRVSRFDVEGNWLGQTSIDPSGGFPVSWKSSEDRSLFSQVRVMPLPGGPQVEGEARDLILRLAPDGTPIDTIATFPSGLTFQMGSGGVPRIRIFSPEQVWAIMSDNRLALASNDRFSIELLGREGAVEQIVRQAYEQRLVTGGERQGFRRAFEEVWSEAGLPAPVVQQFMEGLDFEEHWPALNSVFGGPDGTLWVQRVDPTRELEVLDLQALQELDFGSAEWEVFDPDGRFLGTVQMPDGFSPRRFSSGSLLGVHRDALGVQRIMILSVLRGGGRPPHDGQPPGCRVRSVQGT